MAKHLFWKSKKKKKKKKKNVFWKSKKRSWVGEKIVGTSAIANKQNFILGLIAQQ